MQKSFITIVDTWRFERPLAVVLAAATLFMVMAVPPEHLSAFPSLAAFPAFQPILAVLAGLACGALGYLAMAYPWPRVSVTRPAPEADLVPDDEQGQFAASEVSLRLRRADRHPDAPVRKPIFASRDLGSPFMEIGAFAPPPADEPAEPAILDGDFAEIGAAAVDPLAHDPAPVAEAEPEPVLDAEPEPVTDGDHAPAEPVVVAQAAEQAAEPDAAAEPAWPIPDMPAPIAAFAPEDEPAPATARAPRQSISAMMDRLSAGLERRAAHGDTGAPPADRQPALRDALEELNRLAARRG